jgi:hypothetical protein
MLTHQIIQSEIEELKLVLTEKDLMIPILELYLAWLDFYVLVFYFHHIFHMGYGFFYGS